MDSGQLSRVEELRLKVSKQEESEHTIELS